MQASGQMKSRRYLSADKDFNIECNRAVDNGMNGEDLKSRMKGQYWSHLVCGECGTEIEWGRIISGYATEKM